MSSRNDRHANPPKVCKMSGTLFKIFCQTANQLLLQRSHPRYRRNHSSIKVLIKDKEGTGPIRTAFRFVSGKSSRIMHFDNNPCHDALLHLKCLLNNSVNTNTLFPFPLFFLNLKANLLVIL